MAKLQLPGGTDIAEMAVFDADAMPQNFPKNPDELFGELQQAGSMMRFPTGADGRYLLHAYIDEEIPDHLRSVFVPGEKLEGALRISEGRIAFGGLESCCRGFSSDGMMRSESRVEPGSYRITAFQTDFPDEPMSGEIKAALNEFSSRDRFLYSASGWWVGLCVVATLASVLFQKFALAFGVAIAGAVVHRFLGNHEALREIRSRIDARRNQVDLSYPSIVVEMRSEPRK